MKRTNKYDFDFSEDYESNLETYCDELEKALDKACEELENLSYVKGLGQVGMCYKEWKEWCMKDVE